LSWRGIPPHHPGDVIRVIDGPLATEWATTARTSSPTSGNGALRDVWVAVRPYIRTCSNEVSLAQVVRGDLPRS